MARTAPIGPRLRFNDADDMRRTVTNSGSHYFTPDTMRFFRSRVSGELYAGGQVFVTSEQAPSGIRRYTVRLLHHNGAGDGYSVTNVSGFGAYASLSGAKSAAQRFASFFLAVPEAIRRAYWSSDDVAVMATRVGIPTQNGF